MNHKADCRTAPATSGLLDIRDQDNPSLPWSNCAEIINKKFPVFPVPFSKVQILSGFSKLRRLAFSCPQLLKALLKCTLSKSPASGVTPS